MLKIAIVGCGKIADAHAEQIRRIPVVDRDKRLVGILSLGDVAMADGNGAAGQTLAAISRPSGRHSQSIDMRH